ncbi:MAG: hypothetical protein PHP57_08810 [Sideroxydans sp.]|nr:hypothetical protein [Sideroxydans sp.]
MSEFESQVIELHRAAPSKPAWGVPCNGCGVCCAAEPCPVAYVFLLQFKGTCRALLWQPETNRYVCGMVVCPDRFSFIVPTRWRNPVGRWLSKRVAAGIGCDSDVEVAPSREI